MRCWLFFAALTACQGGSEREPAVPLGRLAMHGYHVLANGASAIPDGEIGFQLTADGTGGYRLTFTSSAGSAAIFAASLTTDDAFDPNSTAKYSGRETVSFATASHIDLSGTPGASTLGLDFVAESEPIYLDLSVDGKREGFGIYFTGATTGLVQASAYDPVAFTSP